MLPQSRGRRYDHSVDVNINKKCTKRTNRRVVLDRPSKQTVHIGRNFRRVSCTSASAVVEVFVTSPRHHRIVMVNNDTSALRPDQAISAFSHQSLPLVVCYMTIAVLHLFCHWHYYGQCPKKFYNKPRSGKPATYASFPAAVCLRPISRPVKQLNLNTFNIHHSLFIIHHSLFIIHHSSIKINRNPHYPIIKLSNYHIITLTICLYKTIFYYAPFAEKAFPVHRFG